jgi:hypothetical protein
VAESKATFVAEEIKDPGKNIPGATFIALAITVRTAREYAGKRQLKLETDRIIAHHAHHGILETAYRHRADTLLIGWKGYTDTDTRDRIRSRSFARCFWVRSRRR